MYLLCFVLVYPIHCIVMSDLHCYLVHLYIDKRNFVLVLNMSSDLPSSISSDKLFAGEK